MQNCILPLFCFSAHYALLPLQGVFMSVYPKGSQMNQHWQPH
jgi:hypothetical protein